MNRKTRYYIPGLTAGGRRLRLLSLATIWLLLDKFHVPDWAMVVFYTLSGIAILAFIVDIIQTEEKEVDIQDVLKSWHEQGDVKEFSKTFQERVAESKAKQGNK